MELTIPTYAKTISETLKARQARRQAPLPTPTPPPALVTAPRAMQPARRPLGRFLQREKPTTFHRCLAVHIHFAQRASALD